MESLRESPGRRRDLDSPQQRSRAMPLVRRTCAVVLAGGRSERLAQLTTDCAKPAVPFAGKFSIVDFALSNCVNAGVRRIGVLTQFRAQSLIRHIEHGWRFLELSLGEFIDLVPAQQQLDDSWYSGTANAVLQNLKLFDEARPDLVLVLAVDADGRVSEFEEKPPQPRNRPGQPGWATASMGIYVFGRQFLADQLARDAADPTSSHDFGHDLLPWMVGRHRVMAHRFENSCVNMVGARPYWRDVGTVDTYWEANIDLVQVAPELNLYDDQWPILSRQRQLPPAKFVLDADGRRGMALDSLVSSGCIVSGAVVRRSILFSKVRVAEGSEVDDSVVLPNVVIGRHVRLRRTVIDMHCHLPAGFNAGLDPAQDRLRFRVTARGITLVTAAMLGQHPKSSA